MHTRGIFVPFRPARLPIARKKRRGKKGLGCWNQSIFMPENAYFR